ncbi:RT36 protein, partial [Crocuta crocuta]
MMGSKMISGSRVVQAVKPHTPVIRFPDRRDNPKPNVSEHSEGCKSPDLLIHQGPPGTAEIIRTLPQKYRRKL